MIEINIHSREQLRTELSHFCLFMLDNGFLAQTFFAPQLDNYIDLAHPITNNRIVATERGNDIKDRVENEKMLLGHIVELTSDEVKFSFTHKGIRFVYFPRSGFYYINGIRTGRGIENMIDLMK